MKPVVASDGTILTVGVQNPGKGFTKAPNVYVVDNTGCGKGQSSKQPSHQDLEVVEDLLMVLLL